LGGLVRRQTADDTQRERRAAVRGGSREMRRSAAGRQDRGLWPLRSPRPCCRTRRPAPARSPHACARAITGSVALGSGVRFRGSSSIVQRRDPAVNGRWRHRTDEQCSYGQRNDSNNSAHPTREISPFFKVSLISSRTSCRPSRRMAPSDSTRETAHESRSHRRID
jgi:hypothetical protein